MAMSFLSFGAGAIGAYIGGSLALAGHNVVFLEQPGPAQTLRDNGLRLSIAGEERRIEHPQVATALETALALGPYDAALFALKSFDTGPALGQLAPFARDLPPFLCLQNGVDNEPMLAQRLGPEKVIAATVTSAIGRRGPGDVVLERLRGMGLDANHPLSKPLAAALNEAGLEAFLYPDPGSMKWSKLLTNLLANASSAILDMTPAEIFAHPGLYQLEIEQLRETLRVMRALGVGPVNLPRTPVRLLAFAAQRLPLALSRPLLGRAVGGGRGAKMPSFHIDLHSGRGHSEVEYLNGAVVRYGEKNGLPTPVNRLLTETLLALTNGEMPLAGYAKQPEKLLG
jgi:2-dehydropantoate 2-reductase